MRRVGGVIAAVTLLTASMASTNAAAQVESVAVSVSCLGELITVNLGAGQLPTDGDDVIAGTEGDDAIAAGGGNDIVCGLGGNDSIWGQGGNDRIDGGDGDDKIRGGDGDDELMGGPGADDLSGGRDNDVVSGGGGDDTKLRGGTGDDVVHGDDGDDIAIHGNGGEDLVYGDEGDDVLITGGPRPDMLWGGPGNDTLRGHKGADSIWGGDGDDTLSGGPQPDALDGGAGTDSCFGGTEIDTAISCETESNIAELRVATFNASMNRGDAGALAAELAEPGSEQPATIAEIIQRAAPDIVLINEFDYDSDGASAALFQENYLGVSQNGAAAIEYPYVYNAPSNTGIASGFDLDNSGEAGDFAPGDSFGFGFFEGQFGMVVYSKYPIDEAAARTFQNFLWKDMPGALLPDDPETDAPADWYSAEELDVFRLSSKSHWDVPITVGDQTVHLLASHPTPPVFDGAEDRNGTRNHDEIRFWADYIAGADYIYDDAGGMGGLAPDAQFVIAGDLNADPFDGDSTGSPALLLTENALINNSVVPSASGGAEAVAQGEPNEAHLGDPSNDTADFGEAEFGGPGNLRVDYVLPSANLPISQAGVFWPGSDDPLSALSGSFPFPSSDHRLVWVDLALPSAALPGEGRSVTVGRANWSSGYAQAQILHDLLEELGYDASSPHLRESSPDLAYRAMANGNTDVWANSWYPGHFSWWEGELADGTPIADNLERIEGSLMPGGGRQGMLITKSWAESNGVTTLDQINDDEALFSQLDTDGNGKGEFFGCPGDWTCDDIMNSQIAFAGWDNLEQVSSGYDAMFNEFMALALAGEPAIIYTWTPTSYFVKAQPGETTMWLSVLDDSVLDDSNPLGILRGEEFDQGSGFSNADPETCLQGPDGCQLGWAAADIEITANKAWLAENPAARALFEVFKPSLLDIATLGVLVNEGGAGPLSVMDAAAGWIADNRELVDEWIAHAIASG